MKKTFQLSELNAIAQSIVQGVQGRTLCFYGNMGVGKTTLIREIVKELGGIDYASSPTFGLVNEYHGASNEVIAYHFDFYRIENEAEALDLGLEDYLSSNAWIFIEWPQKIEALLYSDVISIDLQFIDENTRSIEFSPD